MPWFVRLLVGLFLVAQFAGVVSSPRASALQLATAGVSHDHHQHAHDHGDEAKPYDHHDHSGSLADTCCALHAYFSGILPRAIAIEAGSVIAEPLSVSPDTSALGVPPARLDRPPRPLC
jgi:hypothetical protein